MYSQALRQEIDSACGDWTSYSPRCLAALSEMETQIGNFDGKRPHSFLAFFPFIFTDICLYIEYIYFLCI